MPEFLVFHDHKYCLSFLLVSAYSITVNWYRLTLMGNGGWYGGATFTDLIDYYPSYYDLSECLPNGSTRRREISCSTV